jgi:riboflavin synthase
MFTGIVTAIGEVIAVEDGPGLRRLTIEAGAGLDGLVHGASVSCAGVCLTVADQGLAGRRDFTVEVGPETLALTTAAEWGRGTRLNLERALRLGDELGGHLVAGHVDGIAEITDRVDHGQTVELGFAAPGPLARFIAAKGSLALDGTSLTVNTVDGATFRCHLIPHTLAVTTWADRKVGDRVNLEVDLIARYTERLLGER